MAVATERPEYVMLTFRVEAKLAERIDAAVVRGQRSAVIRQAVEAFLEANSKQ